MALTSNQQVDFAAEYAALARTLLAAYHRARELRVQWDAVGGVAAFDDAVLAAREQTAHLTVAEIANGFNTLGEYRALLEADGGARLSVLYGIAP
jgi:hypothetical protein